MIKISGTRLLARVLKKLRLHPDWSRWSEARRLRLLAEEVEAARPDLLPQFPNARLACLRKAYELL